MTSTLERPPPVLPPLTTVHVSFRRRFTNTAATVVMWITALVAVVALGLVAFYVLSKGLQVISWDFLTQDIPRNPRRAGGGIYPAIVGTLVMTGAAAVMAIPLGVLGAIYLNEFGRTGTLARLVRFMSDVMTGVPSIIMGLFIYTIFVIPTAQFSGLAGAFALAALMLPIVIRSTEEMLRLVPDDLRQASQALGARTWRTTLTVVLPAALAGIVSGSMLAIARAAGETAPLIFVVGIAFEPNPSLSGGNTALSMQIFRNASQPFQSAQERAWGAALTLVAIVFVFTILARVVSRRFAIRAR
jgi:phosphate transport system permease protein